jgi:hypothetical protein
MQNKIIFNGTEYHSLEEMPADVRQQYQTVMGMFADKDQNGIPDAFEKPGQQKIIISKVTTTTTTSDLNSLSPELRSVVDQALQEAKAGQGLVSAASTEIGDIAPANAPIAPLVSAQTPTIQDASKTSPWRIALFVLIPLLVIVLAVLILGWH